MAEELGLYYVSFDRPGYGESDPDPNRNSKSTAHDIEELADQLNLGSKFYIFGASMGGQVIWGWLKYIPHRLAGATLIAPPINYRWPGFPANLSAEVFRWQLPQDQWTLRVAHYTPWLTYWWNTQKWFPAHSINTPKVNLCRQDLEFVSKLSGRQRNKAYVTQGGVFESLHRDIMVGFGRCKFDRMDLKNPFLDGEGSVQLWQGDEDGVVPVTLQRYIAYKLPWLHYHEVKGGGHLFEIADCVMESILKAFLMRER